MVLEEGKNWIGIINGRFFGIVYHEKIEDTLWLLSKSKKIGFREYAFFDYSYMYDDIAIPFGLDDVYGAVFFHRQIEIDEFVSQGYPVKGKIKGFRLSKSRWPIQSKKDYVHLLCLYTEYLTPEAETYMKLKYSDAKIVKLIYNGFWDDDKNEQMGQKIFTACKAYI